VSGKAIFEGEVRVSKRGGSPTELREERDGELNSETKKGVSLTYLQEVIVRKIHLETLWVPELETKKEGIAKRKGKRRSMKAEN